MMSNKQSGYEKLGVDPHKTGVKEAFVRVIDNDFPNAFCNVVRDPWAPGWVLTSHADGSGSKSIQRALMYLEYKRPEFFRGDVHDALSMNTGDIACCGFVDTVVVTDTVAINGGNLPKDELLKQYALGIEELKSMYARHGIKLIFLGGETADLPDQVSSLVLDMNASSRMPEKDLIKGNVRPGDLIFGFSSGGKATWEAEYNSGQMSNGLTLSRISLMHEMYAKKYPFLCRPEKPYRGKFLAGEYNGPVLGFKQSVGEAIISPTRQWAIVIKKLIDELKKRDAFHLLHGLVMNTGGGATKILNIGKSISYHKAMPVPLPLFRLIQQETGELWQHMYTTYNMGVGLDVIGSPEGGILQEVVEAVSFATGIDCFLLGYCRAAETEKNEVTLTTVYGEFKY